METLSSTEGLVYSALVSKAVSAESELFSQDRKLPIGLIETMAYNNNGCLSLPSININKLANRVEMTRNSLKKILSSLREKGLLDKDWIKIPQQVFSEGYFTIPSGTGLSGMQLVFYGYLLSKTKLFKGALYMKALTLAQQIGTSVHNVQCLISILHKKGFIRKLPGGRLIIKNVGEVITTSPT